MVDDLDMDSSLFKLIEMNYLPHQGFIQETFSFKILMMRYDQKTDISKYYSVWHNQQPMFE